MVESNAQLYYIGQCWLVLNTHFSCIHYLVKYGSYVLGKISNFCFTFSKWIKMWDISFCNQMCWVGRKIPAIFFWSWYALYAQPSPHQVLLGGYLVTPKPYVDGTGSYGGISNTHVPFFYYNQYSTIKLVLLLHPIIKLITLRGVPNARCYS